MDRGYRCTDRFAMEIMKSMAAFARLTMERRRRRLWPLLLVSVALVLLSVAASTVGLLPYFRTVFYLPAPPLPPPPPPPTARIPRLAYLVSGSKGDLDRLWRALRALYHPRNFYVVHLDREAPAMERQALAARVANDSLFAAVGNVVVIEKANMVTYRGPTMVANTLHAGALLLKQSKDWDWFINLSASDYPLVTQDDILHAFSSLPRNISFVEHTSRLAWKEEHRAKPVIVDPGLYLDKKTNVFWVSQKRDLPTAFKLFTGSAWVALSREFLEFCVWGWDNLPRILLMYYTNFVSAPEGYFQTVICNAPEFAGTVANHDLHYIRWDVPPKQHPHVLTLDDLPQMVSSGAPFARKFPRDGHVLDRIDQQLLGRANGSFVPGGWCVGDPPCSEVGDMAALRPGKGAERVARLMNGIIRSNKFAENQCR
ncbi:beta-glucuronosyltransferase GlcAT14B-like [Zingiber officinale]|uniref:beta-glucuronosyltransferase GlcAT14B-like n=1 Tax=Zingiber officinale TaxID=94328 RepID=UPI001C4D3EAC|nr:beta-glucuronosyltransferase GlcAT14B-like [Zingiber officinale]